MINNFECQECGSSQVAELDGYFVCLGCGLTIEEPVMQCNIGSFKMDKKGNSIQTHALLINCTQIGNNSERRIKKTNTNFTRLNKINRSLSIDETNGARVIFNTLIAQSGMAISIDHFMSLFNEIYSKIKKRSKSRNLHLFCTTIYYVVMNQQLKNVSLKTLLAERNIDPREFFICVKAIFNEIPDLFKEKAEIMDVMIGQNISKACDELYLSPEVRRIAFKIADSFGDRLGFKSRIIAASAVSIAVRIVSEKKNFSILQISDCLEVTASTVYSYIKTVKIDVLRRNYQEYLDRLINPIPAIVPKQTIQEKMQKLDAEVLIEVEESKPLESIKTKVSIPVITFEKKVKKLKPKTSKFITDNRDIFSRFIPNSMVFESFGTKLKENNLICLDRNFGMSSGVSRFTEFEFSLPIT